MTDEQIVIAIGRKVMGWEVIPENMYYFGSDPLGDYLVQGAKEFYFSSVYERGGHNKVWTPLQSISDAWMIVERMREKGWTFTCRYPRKSSTGQYLSEAEFGWSMSTVPSAYRSQSHSHTMPRAICLAALGALGVGE